ncbi:MAG: hypothetical protein ACK4GC_11925 [Paracoccaceae bacterium]
MSNHEIEDVLSSIRRLVSEDLRPAPLRLTEAVVPEVSDKLLLTPALRVVTAPDGIGQDADASGVGGVTPVADPLAVAPVEDVVARLGAAVTEEEWEAPLGDPQVWPGDVPSPSPLEPRVARHAGGGMDHMPPDFTDAPMAAFAEVEDVLPEPPAADNTRAPLRKVSPPRDDSDWADAAEAAVRADLAQEAEAEVMSGLYGAQAGGMVFDEEVLRDLVRDLIREELSGTLGERITRNVRKLVRAEIARALALREFE